MAYRDPTFNANVLTDLLGTYLTHKSDEREKYYKAAEKANKPQLRSVGGNLVNVYQDGKTEIVYDAPKKAETKFYDEKTKQMIYGTSQEAYGKPTKAPDVPINYQKMGMDYLESMGGRNPGLNLSLFEKNLPLINTEDEWKTWKSEINKEETRDVSNKKSGNLARAQQLVRAEALNYKKIGSDYGAILDNDSKKTDKRLRSVEKKAIQLTFDAYNVDKKVYIKEDEKKLKTDYLKYINSFIKMDKKERERIKSLSSDELFDEIEQTSSEFAENGLGEIPFHLHRLRYRGFNEFGEYLKSLQDVSK